MCDRGELSSVLWVASTRERSEFLSRYVLLSTQCHICFRDFSFKACVIIALLRPYFDGSLREAAGARRQRCFSGVADVSVVWRIAHST